MHLPFDRIRLRILTGHRFVVVIKWNMHGMNNTNRGEKKWFNLNMFFFSLPGLLRLNRFTERIFFIPNKCNLMNEFRKKQSFVWVCLFFLRLSFFFLIQKKLRYASPHPQRAQISAAEPFCKWANSLNGLRSHIPARTPRKKWTFYLCIIIFVVGIFFISYCIIHILLFCLS